MGISLIIGGLVLSFASTFEKSDEMFRYEMKYDQEPKEDERDGAVSESSKS